MTNLPYRINFRPSFYRNTHVLLLLLLMLTNNEAMAQSDIDKWDNQLFIGNKVSWGKDQWRLSGELQTRFKDNMQSMDRWFLEGSANYLISKKWELALPLRFTVKPESTEWRPGVGGLYKMYPKENLQIVHQVQWQLDIGPDEAQHGARYVAFVNYVKSKKFVPNFAAGVFYRWSEEFTGIQFLRYGFGLAWVIDVKHVLNFSYFIGSTNFGDHWTHQGIPFFQLVININKEFKYAPAKYYNF